MPVCRQIEEEASQFTANIENFETKMLPIIRSAEVAREFSEKQGQQLIEQFRLNRSKKLVPANS